MPDDTGDPGLAQGADLAVEPLQEVEATGPKLPSPAQVANAVRPEFVTSKGRVRLGRVTDEAADRVGVKTEEEGNEQVMGIPKSLERLLSDAVVGRRVHQQHA